MTKHVRRNDPCPCGSGTKFKRCCVNTDARSDPESRSVAEVRQTQSGLTLLVETDRGIFARRVPSASPLSTGMRHGRAAEVATQDAAAVWGMPDFVYRPEMQRVGSGTRELGDAIVIVGDVGVVVQVKSRESPSRDAEKEARWIHKKVRRAPLRSSDSPFMARATQ
jgi:hypothetical protein